MEEYNSEVMYCIAIRDPEPDIGKKVVSAVTDGPTLWKPRSILGEDLAIITYTQYMSEGEWSNAHYRDRTGVENLLWQKGSDYVILHGDVLGDDPVEQILLRSLCTTALDLTHYHQDRAAKGELPIPGNDYSIRMDFSATSRDYTETVEDLAVQLTATESRTIEYQFPLSRIVIARELRRLLEETGTTTDLYMAAPATSSMFYEEDAILGINWITRKEKAFRSKLTENSS